MNFQDLQPPILELAAPHTWRRVRRSRARRGSVRIEGYVLAPTGGLTGRFDLASEPMAYLADSAETALYESVFRREVRSCHWDRLTERSLLTFETRANLRLSDLRGLEERFPVLQSMRYETSQAFAQDCRQQGVHGILYASAQHPHHGCVCLFKAGIEHSKKLGSWPLLEPGTDHLLKSVVNAARGSQVPLIRE
jgi:hypothetical protein